MTGTPEPLDYATPAKCEGLSVQHTADGLRIVFPYQHVDAGNEALSWTGNLVGTFLIELGPYLIFGVILFGLGATIDIARTLAPQVLASMPWQFWLFVGLCLTLFGWHLANIVRLRRMPPEIVVTAKELHIRLLQVRPEPAKRVKLSVPRARIYDVKFVEHSGNLVIHAHGCQLTECRPCDSRAMLAEAARVLRQTLRLPEVAVPFSNPRLS